MNQTQSKVTPDGRRITDAWLRRGLRINILAGSLGTAWWTIAYGLPLMMFLEKLGTSGFLMGMVGLVIQTAFAAQLPGALFVERLPARKTVWASVVLASRLLWFVPAALILCFPDRPSVIVYTMIALVLLSSVMGNSVAALWHSWMADLVPAKRRGGFWGMRQSLAMAASLMAMFVAGYVLDLFSSGTSQTNFLYGFMLMFTLGAVLGCSDIVIHLWVPEPKPLVHDQILPVRSRIIDPLRNRDFRLLTLAMGVFTFCVGLLSLGVIYLRRDFHVTYSQLSAITISFSLGAIIFGVIWGYVMDRIGGRAVGGIMLAVFPVLLLVWFLLKDAQTNLAGFFQNVPLLGQAVRTLVRLLPHGWETAVNRLVLPHAIWILLGANFFMGAFYGGITLCQLSLSNALAPASRRTMAMAVHWSVVGLIGALGGVAAGRLMDYMAAHPVDYFLHTGVRLSFQHVLVVIHILVVWSVVLPLWLRITRQKGEPSMGEAVSKLLIASPLSAVTNVYLLGAAATSRSRARAVSALGRKRHTITVRDLIEKLDDPSAEVREAAAYALGRIGNFEAIHALVTKLEDANSDIAAHIARALRASKSPMSVEPLIRKLYDHDRETRSESARTLGEIGDHRAVPSLLDILSASNDAKVISSSSEALAHLGVLAALYDIVPLMKTTRNPVLKRSLALAVGDLLGKREGFYKVLIREEESHGCEVDQLLKDLRRQIRHLTHHNVTEKGRALIKKTDELERMYEEEAYGICPEILFDLATGLADLRWNIAFTGNSKALVNDLIWKDQSFGAGVWYLDRLRLDGGETECDDPGNMDILLGIYFLASAG